MPKGRPKLLKLDEIRTDGYTQVRAQLDEATCREYAEAMRRGDNFPPVDVFFDGADHWLADGFHRYHAALTDGQPRISAQVYQGGREMAVWHAIGANSRNGLRLSNADKRKAIRMALELKPEISNRQIADMVGVDHKTVADVRSEMEAKEQIPQFDRREDAAGKMRASSQAKKQDRQSGSTGEFPSRTDERRGEIPTSQQAPVIDNRQDRAESRDFTQEEVQPGPAGRGQDAPVDRLGNPITDEGIAEAFSRSDELDRLANMLRDIIRTVKDAIDADDPLYADLVPVQIMADLNNAKNQIHHARPYAICPYCNGSGIHKGETCPACYGRGWVGKIAYEHGKHVGGEA